jgi:CheY-like chemotaxis protein
LRKGLAPKTTGGPRTEGVPHWHLPILVATELRVLHLKFQWHGSCIDHKSEGLVTKMPYTNRVADAPVQKVVVVNGNTEVLGMLESVLDAGRYDMVFVEPGDRAYSQIRRVLPDLVILCTRIEQLDGFQLLSMLKLDPATSEIPVLTYTTEHEGQDFDEVLSPPTDDDSMFVSRPALRMN